MRIQVRPHLLVLELHSILYSSTTLTAQTRCKGCNQWTSGARGAERIVVSSPDLSSGDRPTTLSADPLFPIELENPMMLALGTMFAVSDRVNSR